MKNGTFIMVDGIDGAGKSTVVDIWKQKLKEAGKEVLDLKNFWDQKRRHPQEEELEAYDVIISAEPTMVWTGRAIREEMIKEGKKYSSESTAQAFSLDRLILYKRVLVSALKRDKTVIQDRGVSTSLCYQSLQEDNSLDMEYIANLEGNKYSLKNRPDYLVIADVEAKQAIKRLKYRYSKQDESIFEKREFLRKARGLFLQKEFQKFFKKEGSKVKELDCNVEIDIMKENTVSLLKNILNI